MVFHMSLTNGGKQGAYNGTIVCEGHDLNGKKFVHSYTLDKKNGRYCNEKKYFSVPELNDQKEFNSFEEFRNFYKLPELEKETKTDKK
jgi:hypothetical protein